MQTSAAGSPELPRRHGRPLASGFTLLELLVVLAIVAMVSVGVGFSMRDGTQTQLEREALRLSALFESARARSQVSGVPVRWWVTADGFRFEGLPQSGRTEDDLPQAWLDPDTLARVDRPAMASLGNSVLSTRANLEPCGTDFGQPGPTEVVPTTCPHAVLLGPEPILLPQGVTLLSRTQPAKSLRLTTDGVRPFAVQAEMP